MILTFAGNCLASEVIQAEIPTTVELSNRDINRIVCPGPMNDLIFSQEKAMTGHFSGNNGFIKFKIEDSGSEYVYADTQSELFVVCNNAVYTLLVTPADIPSVTLRLASPSGDTFKKNINHYQKMPLEKQALLLIREAYHGDYPASYRISDSTRTVSLSPDLEIQLLQVVDVDGVGLRLRKYQATSLSEGSIDVSEHLFLSSSISNSILAVAVDNHTLELSQSTMVFVVDQKERVK
nr:type-F conjugative transfer system secretin TraK [Desulfoprunum benzoelyticum]